MLMARDRSATWDVVETRLRKLAPAGGQLVQLASLLPAMRRTQPPWELTRNSDGAIWLHWQDVELAIFADRCETYRVVDGKIVARCWPLVSSESIADDLVSEVLAIEPREQSID